MHYVRKTRMRLLDGSLQSGQHAWRGAFERTSAPHVAQTHWWPHGTKACVLSASRHTQHRPPCSAARSSLGLAAPPDAPLAPAPPAAPPLPAAAADGGASKKALAAVCTQPSAARSRRRSSASGGAAPTIPRKEASASASASAAPAAASAADDTPAPSDAAAAGPTLTALARTSVPAAGVGRPATASVRASVALSAWYAWKSSRRLGVGRRGESATSTEPHGHEAASHRALGD